MVPDQTGILQELSHVRHRLCTQCGKVYSLETDLLDTLEKQVFESLGFEVTDHEVKLYGLCSACRRKAQNAMEVKT